ncbi:alpha-L-fucosidase 2 precursor [Pochonia chlamydosporia 170]|uniref:Alpha-L-fucosidase 2 n=1 Tax=Pochonia chlamydosporia 170 TaxID=1380566 RepID=A0A179G395_METCM|nr:alpha-L-fucosidase 2 precursor [Pochonia chlamydosporia 170]OAQ71928.1 alpha-L-fucosidase 2 precursor [Pochonia chlamydosporia 170]
MCKAPEFLPTRHLWYDGPAQDFAGGLPIGNGRLGAVVLGWDWERVIINENSVWEGPFQDRINNNSLEALPKIRDHLRKGDITEASRLVLNNMVASPPVSRAYTVTNNLAINFYQQQRHWSNYRRWLDVVEGVTGVMYDYEGVTYTREYVANNPVGVLAARFTASQEGKLRLTVGLERATGGIAYNIASTNPHTIVFDVEGHEANAIAFSSGVRVVTDGVVEVSSDGKFLDVSGACKVDLFYDTETEFLWKSKAEYKAEVERKLNTASSAGFEKIRADATKDHSTLMNRVSLDLGTSNTAKLSTDTRVAYYSSNPGNDNAFIALMFNFGRHLLISCSRDTGRPGMGVPANLQGIWNEDKFPPWGGKFTVNINTQMNYWLAEATNLPETLLPLWDLIERSRERGRDVAKRMYGCPGSVSHHNLDLWGDSAPHDHGEKWTMWPMSRLWLANQAMDHYRFTGNKEFLRNKVLPEFEAIAVFLNCNLFEFEGYYSTGPSISPENFFWITDSKTQDPNIVGAIDISPTMDVSLLRDFYTNYVDMVTALGMGKSTNGMTRKAHEIRSKLRPIAIGTHGHVREWRKDYWEMEVGHRHISHLWDLFPGSQMSPLVNMTLANAARITLQRRTDNFGGGATTGWSRAWIAACYARLFDAGKALEHARELLKHHVFNNLLHKIERGGRVFQIDSNLGFVAAVAEWFVQSHTGYIHLLPALSSDLTAGSVKGLVTRGGFIVDIHWGKSGVLLEAKIKSTRGGELKVRVSDGKVFKLDGRVVQPESAVATEPGKVYIVTL